MIGKNNQKKRLFPVFYDPKQVPRPKSSNKLKCQCFFLNLQTSDSFCGGGSHIFQKIFPSQLTRRYVQGDIRRPSCYASSTYRPILMFLDLQEFHFPKMLSGLNTGRQ